MKILGIPLGYVMRLAYNISHNYGLAIILFTVISKVVLFPLSLWVHTNGIKMVRIEPALNRLKIKYFGDKDRIADEQLKLFKKEKYNPFSGIIPIFAQLILLIGLIQVIYHPLSYVLNLPKDRVSLILENGYKIDESFDKDSSSAELTILNIIQKSSKADIDKAMGEVENKYIEKIQGINMKFWGIDMGETPLIGKGVLILIPLMATLASLVLSLAQNIINPLQKNQNLIGKAITMLFSVGISLIVGFIVPAGVGFYWIWSNLFTIGQQSILNLVYKPQKHIDYKELAASKKELERYTSFGKMPSKDRAKLKKREKADYKRFFSIANKHAVFYSESSGFYKYFDRIIAYILKNSNMPIHYVTSDPDDQIFDIAKRHTNIKAYYIGERRLITLFAMLEADVVVMTMSDLDNYHYKRSYMRKDIEYIYVFHYPLSTHMVLNKGALDHYDSLLCVGEFQFKEIRQTEKLRDTSEKNLILCGYGQLENLYDSYHGLGKIKRERPKILIAPSWQEDNLLDLCLDELLEDVLDKGLDIVIRPHPEYVKRYGAKMTEIVDRYKHYEGKNLSFELDFTSNISIYDSDMVITDWSGTAYEFSFVTLKPSIFIDTPPKIHNEDYELIGIEPLELTLRNQIGKSFKPGYLKGISTSIYELLDDDSFEKNILNLRSKYIANFGKSGEVGGKYILEAVKAQIDRRNKNNKKDA